MRSALIILLATMTASCSESPTPAQSAPTSQTAEDPLADVLAPSERTLDEVHAFLKPGMTTDQLHEFVKTTPILVKDGRFHWMVKGGSIWTDFELTEQGAVILNAVSQKTPESKE